MAQPLHVRGFLLSRVAREIKNSFYFRASDDIKLNIYKFITTQNRNYRLVIHNFLLKKVYWGSIIEIGAKKTGKNKHTNAKRTSRGGGKVFFVVFLNVKKIRLHIIFSEK
jgi:hypothetical protein